MTGISLFGGYSAILIELNFANNLKIQQIARVLPAKLSGFTAMVEFVTKITGDDISASLVVFLDCGERCTNADFEL